MNIFGGMASFPGTRHRNTKFSWRPQSVVY